MSHSRKQLKNTLKEIIIGKKLRLRGKRRQRRRRKKKLKRKLKKKEKSVKNRKYYKKKRRKVVKVKPEFKEEKEIIGDEAPNDLSPLYAPVSTEHKAECNILREKRCNVQQQTFMT